MNNDILFRGKSIDTKQWVEGFLVTCVTNDKSFVFQIIDKQTLQSFDCYSDSICSCSYLCDKKNQLLFNNDIVKYGNKLFLFKYFNEYGMYGLLNNNKPLGRSGSSTKYEPYIMNKYHTNKMEIVGNYYDNPELLNDGSLKLHPVSQEKIEKLRIPSYKYII